MGSPKEEIDKKYGRDFYDNYESSFKNTEQYQKVETNYEGNKKLVHLFDDRDINPLGYYQHQKEANLDERKNSI